MNIIIVDGYHYLDWIVKTLMDRGAPVTNYNKFGAMFTLEGEEYRVVTVHELYKTRGLLPKRLYILSDTLYMVEGAIDYVLSRRVQVIFYRPKEFILNVWNNNDD